MTPAGFYSVFFRGSQAPQGRPGRFFSGDGRKERPRGCRGLCPAWREGCQPEDTARGCPCVLTVRALVCRPDSERPCFPAGVPGKLELAFCIPRKECVKKWSDRRHGHSAPTSILGVWRKHMPFPLRSQLRSGPALSRRSVQLLSPCRRTAARKKDLTAAGEWHTYLATPRCGVHVGK